MIDILRGYTVLAAAEGASTTSSLLSFLPLIGLFALMYFLMIRPQKKKEKELRQQIDAMRVGDTVMTIGGVIGRVVNILGDEVTIVTSVANTMITFKKSAISTVTRAGEPVTPDQESDKKAVEDGSETEESKS